MKEHMFLMLVLCFQSRSWLLCWPHSHCRSWSSKCKMRISNFSADTFVLKIISLGIDGHTSPSWPHFDHPSIWWRAIWCDFVWRKWTWRFVHLHFCFRSGSHQSCCANHLWEIRGRHIHSRHDHQISKNISFRLTLCQWTISRPIAMCPLIHKDPIHSHPDTLSPLSPALLSRCSWRRHSLLPHRSSTPIWSNEWGLAVSLLCDTF